MNNKKREEVKTLLGVLPKSAVRNILIAGEKPWKATLVTGIFVSAIYTYVAAKAFYNNEPSDGIFYSAGILAAIGLVPFSIRTMNSTKKKQLYLSMINQVQIQIAKKHSKIIMKDNKIDLDSSKQTKDEQKLTDKSDLLLKIQKQSYKKALQEIRDFNSR